MDNLFLQISLLLGIAVGISFFVRLLRQPLIIAYILAGIICGPLILNLVHGDYRMYETFAQFGVVLLLFIIGLNLNFRHLKSIGKTSVITGLGQVLFTAGIGIILLFIMDYQLTSALYLAIAITFSSTIIIMKMLTDKKDTESTYGRYTIGLMLVQDLIAVALIIALGIMQGNSNSNMETIVWLIVKLFVVASILYLISKYILPKLLEKIAGSSELLFLFTLAWCFGVASILYMMGFSLEIGAIISGIALSSSPYQLEIASRSKPLRDFFLILFFIVLGSEMGFSHLGTILVPAIVLSLFILIGNPLILYLLFRTLKFTRRNSFMAGLTAAQVSEFGFVLLFAGRQMGHIHGDEVPIFTIVAILTIFSSTYLISHSEKIYHYLIPFFKLFGPDRYQQSSTRKKSYDAWIIGYHRIGMKIAETFGELKTKYTVVDYDPSTIPKLRKNRIPFYFGDVADIEFLESIPIANSKIIVMTIPNVDDQINLVQHVHHINPKILIIGNAYQQYEAEMLYRHGANFVMMPHFLGGHWMAKILRNKKLNQKTLKQLKSEQEDLISA